MVRMLRGHLRRMLGSGADIRNYESELALKKTLEAAVDDLHGTMTRLPFMKDT